MYQWFFTLNSKNKLKIHEMGGIETTNQMIGKLSLAICQTPIFNRYIFSFFIIANIKSSKQKKVRYQLIIRQAMTSCIYKLKMKLFIVLINSLQAPRYPQDRH